MELFVLSYITEFAYIGIFTFLILTVFGFPFPEDAVLLVSGAVISKGVIALAPTLFIAYFGVLTGDLLLYFIGRRYGRGIIAHRRFGRVLTRPRLMRARRWFRRWGGSLVFFGRHLVGVRAQIFLCAGVVKYPARRVVAYDSLSALIGVPVMIGIGYLFGHNLPALTERVSSYHWGLSIAAVCAAVVAGAFFVIRKKRAGQAA